MSDENVERPPEASSRRIGPIGTASRVVVALVLLFLVVAWGIETEDVLIGFIALPAVFLAIGLIARRYATGPVHFTGVPGLVLNCAVIVALVANPYTVDGALLFYGVTMLIAAWLGQPGCEGTVISNLILRRDDQIGCPLFRPVDEVDERLSARRTPA